MEGIVPEQGEDNDAPYEGISDDADNDPNLERVEVRMSDGTILRGTASALLGWTNARIGVVDKEGNFIERARWGRINAPAVIGRETIRDVVAEHRLNESQVLEFVVAHEMGHQFGLWHSTIYSAADSDLTWTPRGNFMEPDIANMRARFTGDPLRQIRRIDSNP